MSSASRSNAVDQPLAVTVGTASTVVARKRPATAITSQPLVAGTGVVCKRPAGMAGSAEGSVYDRMKLQQLRDLCGRGNNIKEKKKTIGGKFVTKSVTELRAEFNNEYNQKKSTQLRLEQCFSGEPASGSSV